jgi:acyl-CoA thioesterase FadM
VKHLGGASLDLDQEVRRGDRALVRLALCIACLGRDGRPRRLPAAIAAGFASLHKSHATEE